MEAPQKLAEQLLQDLAAILVDESVNQTSSRDLLGQLLQRAFELPSSSDNELVTVRPRRHEPPVVIYYNPAGAIGILASLLGGAAGGNPVAWGAAALSVLYAVRGSRNRVPLTEGALLWVLYNCDGHRASADEASRLFVEACQRFQGLAAEDFNTATQGLLHSGCVKRIDGMLHIADKVVVHWNNNLTSIFPDY